MKKLKLLFLLFFILTAGICQPQSDFVQFVGGDNSEGSNSVVQAADGNYVIAGGTYSFGVSGQNVYYSKVDNNHEIWSKTIGGSAGECALSLIKTSDGGYAIAGYTNSIGSGDYDMYVVKVASDGTPSWAKAIGGSAYDVAYNIIQTSDGGYVLVGTTQSFGVVMGDLYIVKLNSSGTVLWSRTFGSSYLDIARSVVEIPGGGLLVVGSTGTASPGISDFCILKLDNGGAVSSYKIYGGSLDDYPTSLTKTSDGYYIIVGATKSFTAAGLGVANSHMYIVKIDVDGNVVWKKIYGGMGEDVATSVIQDNNGSIIVAGYSNSSGLGNYDYCILKLDYNSGNATWCKTVGGTGEDKAYSVIQSRDGRYVVSGNSSSSGAVMTDALLIKFEADGTTCGNSSPFNNLAQAEGGSYSTLSPSFTNPQISVVTPHISFSYGSPTSRITGLCNLGVSIQPISGEVPASYSISQNYPNPFNPATKIQFALPNNSDAKLIVYDALGKEIETLVDKQLSAGVYEAEWNASSFASGVYYYKLTAGSYSKTMKMLLVK